MAKCTKTDVARNSNLTISPKGAKSVRLSSNKPNHRTWNERLLQLQAFFRTNIFTVFVVIFYVFCTAYYMGPSFFQCGQYVNGFGDSTAGPIWRNSIDGTSPFLGYEKYTNYPFGENLASPIDLAVGGQTLLLWTISKATSPVCGYNLTNALGYITTALVMFGFIYALTNKRWIAVFAGYAVSFTPFFQAKVGAHPGYGYAALLIGATWAFLAVLQTRKLSRTLLFVILAVTAIYFDPYFSLLLATMLLPIALVYIVISARRWIEKTSLREMVKSQLKQVATATALILVFITPLLSVMLFQKSKIDTLTQGTRDNIADVAEACSNWPHEYLLPYPNSPLLGLLGNSEAQVRASMYAFSTCGIAEDAVGIAAVLIFILGCGLVVLIWEKVIGRKLELDMFLFYDSKLIFFGFLSMLVLGILVAAPPLHVFGVPTPSELIISTISIWRVFSREYMVVNIAVVVLVSIILAFIAKRVTIRPFFKGSALALLFLFVGVQYQTGAPFAGNTSGSYNFANVAPAYEWLKSQSDIKAIAEFPMEKITETNTLGYYLTAQVHHMKPLLNSALVNHPQSQLHSSIKNLNDPQTIPVLKALGIDYVLIHGIENQAISQIPGLTVIYSSSHKPGHPFEGQRELVDNLAVAKIGPVTPAEYSIRFQSRLPYNAVTQVSPIKWEYEVPSASEFSLSSEHMAMDKKPDEMRRACFDVKMAAKNDSSILTIRQVKSGAVILDQAIGEEFTRVRFEAPTERNLELLSSDGGNMRITAIGCLEGEG